MDESLNIRPSSTRWQGSRCADWGVFCAQCWCCRWNQGASWRGVVEMFGFDRWGVCWYLGKKVYFPSATWGSFLEFAYKWSSESGMRWPRQRILDISGWTVEEMCIPDGSLVSLHWKFSSKWRDRGWCVLGGFPFWPKQFGRFLITNISIYVGYHFFKGTSRDHHFWVSSRVQLGAWIDISGFKQHRIYSGVRVKGPVSGTRAIYWACNNVPGKSQIHHDRWRNTHLYVNMNTYLYIYIHIADTLHMSPCNSLEKETPIEWFNWPTSERRWVPHVVALSVASKWGN